MIDLPSLLGFSSASLAIPLILLIAAGLDALLGEPRLLYDRLPHPVVLIGRLIDGLEARLNDPGHSARRALWLGMLVSVLVIASTLAVGLLVALAARAIPLGWLWEAFVISSLLAWRALDDGVALVARRLDTAQGGTLEKGREAVSHIVGRSPDSLDEAGVARAAIESGAENLSDGVIAPVFWCLLFGLPGLAAYKAINTLDSMIGHRWERYRHFGCFAARLDDIANWIPARLTGLLICLAAVVLPQASGHQAFRAMTRDASRHRSPNAGWPEAAVAGALGLSLGGPRVYKGESVDEPFMGHGSTEATPGDIRQSLRLTRAAYVLGLGGIAALWLA